MVNLGEMRSYFDSNVPDLALTATANPNTTQVIVDERSMHNCLCVTMSPKKLNIKYVVPQTEDDLFLNFNWLIDELLAKRVESDRNIIFCSRTKHVWELFLLFSIHKEENAYHNFQSDGVNDDRNRLFAMFHSGTDDAIKLTVQKSFATNDSILRVFQYFRYGFR